APSRSVFGNGSLPAEKPHTAIPKKMSAAVTTLRRLPRRTAHINGSKACHLFLARLELLNGICIVGGHLLLARLELFNPLLHACEIARHRLDDKNHQTFRHGAGLRSSAPQMGRRTYFCMARSLSQARKGFRSDNRQRRCLGARCAHPHPRKTDRKSLRSNTIIMS